MVVAAAALLGALAVPAWSSAGAATVVAETCTTTGPPVESGSKLISKPMAEQIAGSPLAIDIPIEATATSQINPGGVVGTTATLHLDLATIAHDVLEQRVKPGVVAAGYPQLAPTAWVVLDLDDTRSTFALPPGATPLGSPTASSSASAASAMFSGSDLQVDLGHLSADTRSPGPVTDVTVSWQLTDGGAPAPRALDLLPPTVSFTTTVSVGLLFYGAPVVGAVTAPWACTPDEPDLVLATTAVVEAPVSTTSTTAPTTTGSTGTTTPTSTTTTTTPWPTSTTTPTGACAVEGFDRFGGWTGLTLDATGSFRTTQINGHWWLVDPDGHPFFSQGINHITAQGTPDKNGQQIYRDTVTSKYGTDQAWADAQVQRMGEWGYNTIGAWSDLDTLRGHTPYTVLLNMTGQNWTTGQMEDLFAPSWAAGVQSSAQSAAATYGNDPYLLGYWSDNELHFGPDWRMLHLFDDYLARAASTPGKQALLAFLQNRYPTFDAFAADFTTTATDWASLAAPSTVTAWTTPGGQDTRTAWVAVVAERYFSVIDDALTAADPNHLFLGPRFIAQTAGRPLLEAAARHVDVLSLNRYQIVPELEAPLTNADPSYLPVTDGAAAQAAIAGKPILISEWSYRAADSGLPNTFPPLFPTLETQAQRAAMYEKYVQELLDTPWVVGQHWFEHADEPAAGRFDGEDSNFGLVTERDEPYPLMTAISRTMHDCAYARLPGLLAAEETTTTTSTPTDPGTTDPGAANGGANAGGTSSSTSSGTTSGSPVAATAVATQPAYTG